MEKEKMVNRKTLIKWVVKDMCSRRVCRYTITAIILIIFAVCFAYVAYLVSYPKSFTENEIRCFTTIADGIFYDGVTSNASEINEMLDTFENQYEITVSSGSEIVISTGNEGNERRFIADYSIDEPNYSEEYSLESCVLLTCLFFLIGGAVGWFISYITPKAIKKYKNYISIMKKEVVTLEDVKDES